MLESLTAVPVTSFAYPFGGPEDVSERTRAIVQEEGITIACTTEPDSVRPGRSRHDVPRVIVGNWPRAEFLQRWSSWTASRDLS